MIKALLILLSVCSTFGYVDIPSTNRIDWTNYGVSNGIPSRTTIFATLNPGDNIQTSINSCPSNQVVLLNPGTYTVSANLLIQADGVVLRGSGVDSTILVANYNLADIVKFDGLARFWYYNDGGAAPASASLSSGYTRGSTTVTAAASTTDLAVGTYAKIYEGIYPELGTNTGLEGGPSTNCVTQMVRITGVSGANLTFFPPLNWTYQAAYNPRIWIPVNASSPANNFIQMAGLENMTISNKHSTANSCIRMQNAAHCWVSNVKTVDGGVNHYDLQDCFRCTFQHGVLKGVLSPITSSRCYGMTLGQTDSSRPPHGIHNCYVFDNAYDGLRSGIVVGYGSSANVVAYNLFTNAVKEVSTILSVDMSIHSAHPMFNLFEGNIASKVDADYFHGSASHNVFFRNALRGRDQNTQTTDLEGLVIGYTHGYYSALGNVFGYNGVATDIAALPGTATYSEEYPATEHYNNSFQSFKLGYASVSTSSPGSTNVAYTLFRHGNWDWVTSQIYWDATVADHALSNSLYRVASPFPAGYTDPPIESTTHTVALTPAQQWYTTQGKWDNGAALGGCSYSIDSNSSTADYSGVVLSGSSTVAVTATVGCAWTAAANVGWLTITSGASGTGNGTVTYSVSANTGALRSGTMTIAGQTFTVNQNAAPSPGSALVRGNVNVGPNVTVK